MAPRHVVVLADLGAAQAREVAFCLVRAGTVLGEGDGVIDPAQLVVSVQAIPAASLIGKDDGPLSDEPAD